MEELLLLEKYQITKYDIVYGLLQDGKITMEQTIKFYLGELSLQDIAKIARDPKQL